jgi:recombination protein RecA
VGISREGEMVDLGTERGIIEKSGAWYSYAGERIGQGRENAKDFLRDHPELAAQVDRQLREQFGIGGPREADAEPEVRKAGKASS